ncbi:MAG: cation:proton antiporter [Planctomycetota bacterium]|jgi:CPA1 family monovalent cation:H+ antiporter
MSLFAVFATLITITALLSYLNKRLWGLPTTIGVMASALVCSLLLALVGRLGLGVDSWAESLLLELDFGDVLMKGMLSFLLFAGALHVDLGDLVQRKWSILSLATGGVVLSTFLVGTGIYFVLPLFGLDLLFGYALLFGALISPTDPIAVLGILRSANAPRRLEATIIGESLFNDGVGVVVFTMILELVAGGHGVSAFEVGELFLTEALGGVVFGLGLGYVAYRLLKTVDDHVVELLITLSLVSGGYVLAGALHTSGPIAMVVAGLFIGNHGRIFGMSDGTRQYQDVFWELIDELLNAVLFVMIGFEVLVLRWQPGWLVAGLTAIPLVLAVRFICVGLPISILRTFRRFDPATVRLMTWGGIRGGISIALALSIPPSPNRDVILAITYTVVVFSILVQGLTVGRAVRWAIPATRES